MPLRMSVHRYSMALLAYAFAAIMVGTTLPTPMYALFAEELHFHVLTTTIIFAAYAGGVLAALLLFGRWSDVVGRRPVLLAGITMAAASAVVFVLADSVPELLIGRVLSGLSAGLFTGTATAAVIEAAPEAWRGRAAAVASVVNIGGLGLGPVLAGVLVQYAPRPLDLSFVVHLALTVAAAVAVLCSRETSPRQGKLGLQRLAVPVEARSVFVVAALAAFAGFAVTGLFAAVAPSFLAEVIGIGNHALAGLIAGTIFLTSAVAQVVARSMNPERAVALGCAILIAGMATLAVALHVGSLPGLIAAAVVSGIGQGISFSRGLAAVSERTPPDRRAEVSSTYFVVAYVAIAVPVIGEGLAAQAWGLRTSGVVFAVAVAVLAAGCLIAILSASTHSKDAAPQLVSEHESSDAVSPPR
ncbi:MFS transporter [Mycolicibacterium obuense]|uniref:MFS transporter n=1 Tax=Mycolicibacterium obuense TaxID=1807 RepID=A0A0J6W4R1_9MYCO|nr:MFS transporter [Mycolicibacterium obuense]KMO77449.1 Multidrug resistance protein MdtL [Mycolicibacterium obuense]TDL06556.1 MFS transporter [Mycolicibacterium obuense]